MNKLFPQVSLLLQSGLLEPPQEEEAAAVLRKELEEERARHVGEVAHLRDSVSAANAELAVAREELEHAQSGGTSSPLALNPREPSSLLASDQTVQSLRDACSRDTEALTGQLAERTQLVQSLQAASDAVNSQPYTLNPKP